MAGMMDELLEAVGGEDALGSLLASKMGGGNPAELATAAKGGIGAILGGLATNAKEEQGAGALFDALSKKHDGSALGSLDLLGDDDQVTEGGKILGHVFGDNQESVINNLAGSAGVSSSLISKLLPALAPIVMGFLGKKALSGGLNAGSLASLLGGAMDDDGFGLDDIVGMLAGGGSSSGGAGAIGGILKGLLGGK